MKRTVIYILGLFENQENSLFTFFKKQMESSKIEYHGIELFAHDKFGSCSFLKTLEQAREFVRIIKPKAIIAHSLGAYVAMQIPLNAPVFLLDPSFSITDIILNNNLKQDNGLYSYDDGKQRIALSSEFVESIEIMPSIEKLARNMVSRDVYIFGSGKGGYKITEQYHKHIPRSQYIFLSDADHNFSNEDARRQIMTVIKKRLDAMSSRGGDVRTKSW